MKAIKKGKNQRKRKGTEVTVAEDSDNTGRLNNDTLEHLPLKKPNIGIANTGSSTYDENSSGSDAESEEWQDVEDGILGESFYKPETTAASTCQKQDNLQGNVLEISIDIPGTSHSSGKKSTNKYDWSKEIQFQINRYNKALQLHLHKASLICLVASVLHSNNMCNNAELQARALSQVPIHLVPDVSSGSLTFNPCWISEFIKWFSASYCVTKTASRESAAPAAEVLHKYTEEMEVSNESDKVLICLTTMRALGLQARLIQSLQPIPLKYNMLSKVRSKQVSQKECLEKGKSFDAAVTPKKIIKRKEKVSKTNAKSDEPKRNTRGKASHKNLGGNKNGKKKKTGEANSDSDDEADELWVPKEHVPAKRSSALRKASSSHILSSDSEDECRKDVLPLNRTELYNWIEVYTPQEKKWICVCCAGGHINRPDLCEQSANDPICYIIAIDNENSVKDVTKRYASKWMHETQKLRAPSVWWEKTLQPYCTELITKDKEEDEHLKKQLQEKPLPTSISEYKNHHLYVLKRHLLKFEALYPESATILGYCRSEAVYSRNCVHNLHTKETWMKQALAIQHGEQPYKMVKARQKKNKSHEPLLPLYGQWQTELYIPPAAVDGKVPRNDYGNVELFQPSMLPMGTVHLQIPGLNRAAQKIGVDCAPAMVGWDFHGGFCHPVFDGYVVCKEFTESLLDMWEKDNAEKEQKLHQKKIFRVEKNWKTLITGVLIRERLHERFQGPLPPSDENNIDSWPRNKLNQLKDEEK